MEPAPVPEHPSGYAGWVRVGRGVLYVGPERASALELSDAPEATARDEIATALDRRESDDALDAAEDLVATAKDATAMAEHGEGLLRMLADGADPRQLAEGIQALLAAALDRYRAGRYRDFLRLAHVTACVLTLAWRWRDLVRLLDLAADAARAIGETAEEAWALHELGTLAVAAERGAAAREWLARAEELYGAAGDSAAAALSAGNLRRLATAAPPPPPPGVIRRIADWPTRTKAAAGMFGVAAVLGLGAANLPDPGPDAQILGFTAATDTAAAQAFNDRQATEPPEDAVEPGGTVRACDPPYLIDFIEYENMDRDARVLVRVSVDGRPRTVDRERWRGPQKDVHAGWSYRGEGGSTGEPIQYGRWKVVVEIDGETRDEAEVTVERACP